MKKATAEKKKNKFEHCLGETERYGAGKRGRSDEGRGTMWESSRETEGRRGR